MKNKKAYSRTLRILARKGYSEEELREKIRDFASEEEADEILEECKRCRYIDEKALAEYLIEKQMNKTRGYYYISSLLEKRKIHRNIIECMKKNFDFDREFLIAKKFFLKKRKKVKTSSLIFSLKNRGFSFPTINRLMNTYGEKTEWTAER